MTDEATQNEQPENEEGIEFAPFTEMPHALRAALISSLGGGGINEAGVHGSVLAQTQRLVEEYIKPELAELTIPGTDETAPVIVGHDGVKVVDATLLDGYRTTPRFRRGTAVMTDLTSFIGHVNRYKDDHSVIFAKDDQQAPGLTAVLDYNEADLHITMPGDPVGEHLKGKPRFGKHRTQFNFPVSPEWRAWTSANATHMTMASFAQFIEDRYVEIIPPAVVASTFTSEDDPIKKFVDSLGGVNKLGGPADLMRIASGLSVHESSVVGDVVRLASGEGSVTFTVEHETQDAKGEKFTVPPAFGVAVPVFRGEAPFCVIARLRYRKSGGKLVLWYELYRADLTFDTAVNDAVEKVQSETGLIVWKGQPEA